MDTGTLAGHIILAAMLIAIFWGAYRKGYEQGFDRCHELMDESRENRYRQ